jgi:hypothetical protein
MVRDRAAASRIRYFTFAHITAAALLLFGRSTYQIDARCILNAESRLPEGYDVAELCFGSDALAGGEYDSENYTSGGENPPTNFSTWTQTQRRCNHLGARDNVFFAKCIGR